MPGSGWIARGIAAACAVAALGCHDVSEPGPPHSLPAFVYVADSAGFATLFRWRNDTTVALTSGSNNSDPNSAGGRITFTSDRDGYPQVYLADPSVDTVVRVMNSGAIDKLPSLSPHADSIVFVSTRSGTTRLWVVAAPPLTGPGSATAGALATGSPSYTPETAPAWSPVGGEIAFTSVRSGTSQVYVMPSGGGSAVAVTGESGGAFQPAWSADGSYLYYIAAASGYALRRVPAHGGSAATVVPDSLNVAGPASCDAWYCVYSTGFNTASGDMSALLESDGSTSTIFPRTAARERQPAILRP